MPNVIVTAARIAYRHFDEIGHRRKMAIFLVAMPIVLMSIFGTAFSQQKVPVGIAPDSLSSVSELKSDPAISTLLKLVREYREGDIKTNVKLLAGTFNSPSSPTEKLLIYVLPGNLTSVVVLDGPRYYYVGLGSNSIPRSIRIGDISEVSQLPDFSSRLVVDMQPLFTNQTAMKFVRAASGLAGFAVSALTNEEVRLLDLVFPDVVGLQIMWAGVLGASVMAVEDRVAGARRRILMAPIPRSGYILGNAFANFALVFVEIAILFSIALGIFSIRILGSIADLLVVVAVASFVTVGLGLIVSHFSKSADEAFYFSTFINIPMGFLSSTVIPISRDPLATFITSIFPMTHANLAMRQIAVNGLPLSAVLPQLSFLLVIGAVVYALGVLFLRIER